MNSYQTQEGYELPDEKRVLFGLQSLIGKKHY
jgi:hypothetical protein